MHAQQRFVATLKLKDTNLSKRLCIHSQNSIFELTDINTVLIVINGNKLQTKRHAYRVISSWKNNINTRHNSRTPLVIVKNSNINSNEKNHKGNETTYPKDNVTHIEWVKLPSNSYQKEWGFEEKYSSWAHIEQQR